MKRTLYLKFLMAYLIFGLFGFVLVSYLVSTISYRRLVAKRAEDCYREANFIVQNYAVDLYKSNISLDQVSMHLDAIDKFMDVDIWIINPSGRMILDTRRPFKVEETVIIDGFDPTITGSSYYVTGTFFDSFPTEQLSVLAPITADYKVKGYVVIHADIEALAEESDNIVKLSYAIFVALFILSLIILFAFTEIVYLPLRKITKATEQYAAGNMHYEFHVDSGDEIGYLAASLSYMASEIARAEDNQKKFIANVSHDFRSPLTSIRGYLEAMIDGTIPPEMHEKYLNVVLSDTERLTKLTNNLLALNNLNVNGCVLEKTAFDINKVIRNVAMSFEGTCTKKGIGIDLVLTGEVLPVVADEEKIKQVLYNLLDNAIKFSHSNSTIKIETTEKHSKIFVSVKDAGIGIPKDDIKFVFDRFYKSDYSRGKDKKGTGLGLSIVKEIINAHEENINVISTEGVGTEFIFSLSKYEE